MRRIFGDDRTLTTVILMGLVAWMSASGRPEAAAGSRAFAPVAQSEGLVAWQQVHSVLIHPRCLNCHTATNYAQQGDDRHRHLINVVRGPEGKGVPGLNCTTCHQEANADDIGVPGAPNWHLAPLSMAWQDRNDQPLSSSEVCGVLTDRSKNHDLDGPGLLKHHQEEALVRWSFQPGRGINGVQRTLPPLTHQQFVDATRRWVEAGTPCP